MNIDKERGAKKSKIPSLTEGAKMAIQVKRYEDGTSVKQVFISAAAEQLKSVKELTPEVFLHSLQSEDTAKGISPEFANDFDEYWTALAPASQKIIWGLARQAAGVTRQVGERKERAPKANKAPAMEISDLAKSGLAQLAECAKLARVQQKLKIEENDAVQQALLWIANLTNTELAYTPPTTEENADGQAEKYAEGDHEQLINTTVDELAQLKANRGA